MAHEKIATLIRRLINGTRKGQLAWQETSEDEIFIVAFPGYSASISQRRGRSLETDYVLTIIDQEGRVIEQVTDVDLQHSLSNSYGIMEDLYEAARRNVRGVDAALDRILSHLPDDDDEIPF